ncbi:hypothetical protein ACIO3R_30570 [Streptomyces sp. NPDC087428]|uniref:hypothetical protein n=1 Tax=Streptomyces sp. NPDC087428 TaxID=3365788 RepID=UPI0037FB829D
MSRSARLVTSLLVLAFPLLAMTACAPDKVDARCAEGTCTLHARSGTSIAIQNLELDIEEVSETYVKLSSHGVSLKLAKKLDLRVGGHRLHLVGTQGGTADIEVE